ncbi:MAG: long-chain fatty acid--CoA ligase [Candidatus Marinimicrobia bacterium]|nr:long-chain fatty acid--CoA ligase [Candidatus Neomarinimicrobiota bacterium]
MEWPLSNPDLSIHNTVPKLFWYNVEHYGSEITAWWKQKGLWESITWKQYGDWSRDIANALLNAGIKRGDKVSILSQTRFEWVVVDLAIMSIGGVTAPIYHSNTEDQVHYIAEHSGSKLVFAEDQEQLDKLLEIWDKLPEIKQIIVFDKYQPKDIPNVTSLSIFREEGIQYGKENPDHFIDKISKGSPEDLISFIYTSGTTGHPKAGMINSRNVLAIVKHLKTMYNMTREDMSIAYLPLAHIAERDLGHFMKLYIGNVTVFAESLEDMPANLRQTGPTVMFGTPRVFEKFYAQIATGIKDATWIQKTLYNWSLKVGRLFVEAKDAGKSPSPFLWIKHKIAHFLIFRKIHDIFGGRIRFMISGAAPISPNIVHFFHWIGLDIYEVYGMTETTGVISANNMGQIKIGSVGQIFPDTEVKIAEDGEILCRGPQNIQGYYGNEDATAELLIKDENGIEWLYTGDVGHIDEDGYLFITDRKKDLIITASGKNVAPQNIENLLKTSPYVSQAMVYGDKKPYLTALVTLDEDEIAKFARDRKILYQDLGDLTKKKEIIDLIHHEISTLNRELASYETIKKFYIPEEDFNQDKDELTPTMKVRRKVVTERYKNILENLYQT